jgi:hypothetical protein
MRWTTSTGRNGYDLGHRDVPHDSDKDYNSGVDYHAGVQDIFWAMSLYNRLVKEKRRLGEFVLRSPKTPQELLDRKRRDRIMTILMRRYEYGINVAMEDMKRQDQFDEIATIKIP